MTQQTPAGCSVGKPAPRRPSPRAAKRRGTGWETVFVRWLVSQGWPRSERRALHGSQDLGDIINGPADWTLELKNQQTLKPSFVDEAERESVNAGTRWYAAVMKRRGKGDAGEALIVMKAANWIELVRLVEELSQRPAA